MLIICKVMNLWTLMTILIKEIVWMKIQVTMIQLAAYGIMRTQYLRLIKKSNKNKCP